MIDRRPLLRISENDFYAILREDAISSIVWEIGDLAHSISTGELDISPGMLVASLNELEELLSLDPNQDHDKIFRMWFDRHSFLRKMRQEVSTAIVEGIVAYVLEELSQALDSPQRRVSSVRPVTQVTE